MTIPSWNLILAAGAGRRLASLTGGTPKQFWRPDGSASLLDDTVERLAPLAPPQRTITVVDRTHRPYIAAHPRPRVLGEILYQPQDRGTAAGVLLGLSALAARAPESIVVMTPSDHGVVREEIFRAGIHAAVAEVRSGAREIVLFGVEPDQPHGDYGWITPVQTDAHGGAPLAVGGFVEKPATEDARRLFASGAVWNTMVLVARTRALLDLYRRHLPHLHDVFELMVGLPGDEQARVLEAAYADLPRHDFSRDLLTPATNLSLIVWPEEMGWSDLGTPERLLAWRAPRRVRQTAFSAA